MKNVIKSLLESIIDVSQEAITEIGLDPKDYIIHLHPLSVARGDGKKVEPEVLPAIQSKINEINKR